MIVEHGSTMKLLLLVALEVLLVAAKHHPLQKYWQVSGPADDMINCASLEDDTPGKAECRPDPKTEYFDSLGCYAVRVNGSLTRMGCYLQQQKQMETCGGKSCIFKDTRIPGMQFCCCRGDLCNLTIE